MKLETKHTIELTQFVETCEIDPLFASLQNKPSQVPHDLLISPGHMTLSRTAIMSGAPPEWQ